MNDRKKNRKRTILTVAVLLFIGLAALIFLNLPRPINTDDSSFDLTQLSDGTYTGSYDNKLVNVQAEVDVLDHAITDIRIIRHQNGLGSAAERITDDVIRHQSVEVDTISGATLSSQTILKAIEQALSKGE